MTPTSLRVAAAVAIASALTVPLISARAERPQLPSLWRTAEIVIDGASNDWPSMTTLSEDPPLQAGFANDGVYLYVAVRTADPAARMQIVRQGLIVWFDPAGGEKKRFGVHYPDTAVPPAPRGGRGGPRGSWPPPGDMTESGSQEDGRWRRLEILGPGKDDVRSLMLDKVPAIEVSLDNGEGELCYELKVPLRVTSETPYAIGTVPGREIGVGLETTKIEMPGGRGGVRLPGMGGRGGGMGGSGGAPGRGQWPPDEDQRPKKIEPIKLWVRVAVANPPAR